jgi:hypothetical protein
MIIDCLATTLYESMIASDAAKKYLSMPLMISYTHRHVRWEKARGIGSYEVAGASSTVGRGTAR